MRYYNKKTITISDDEVLNPKEIAFEEKDVTIDKRSGTDSTPILSILKCRNETFPIGTFVLDVSNLTTAQYFFIEADNPITIDFNSETTPKTLLANIPSEFWMVYTAISIETTVATKIKIAYGGV